MRAVSPERAVELFNEFGRALGARCIKLDDGSVLVDRYTVQAYEVHTMQWLVYEVYRLQCQQKCFKGVRE